MVAIGRKMDEKGLIVAVEGNLSVRLGSHSFLVTPAGINKGGMRVQDLLEIDTQGRCPRGRPTSEWPLHREIYRHRQDVRAVCHAHPPWATAFAAVGRDLDGTLLTETADILPRVPLAARSQPGTESLAASVLPHIARNNAVLLGSHGAVAVGSNLQEAFYRLETVERLAQVTLLSEAAAGRSMVAPEVLGKLQKGGY